MVGLAYLSAYEVKPAHDKSNQECPMIVDVHVHHVPEPFVRFVEKAAPYAMHLAMPQAESVTLRAGALDYALNRTFFDVERLLARMNEMRVDRAVLSLATPFVNY